jgi:alkanesulfonate monooxygenase SsuD/methylene tetrahydromethanopterin reductase-like flavin-dependent oxidoreductase (luciferase family)
MQCGFHLTPLFSPPERPPSRILDEIIQVVHAASTMGYAWVSAPHHWLSYPTVWPQPYPLPARLAPEAGSMRLKTSELLLPLLNAVEVAENVATLDHLTHGRLTLGVAIGYRDEELQVVGLRRQDRVAKFEESLHVMKRLWAGEAVTFTGKYITLSGARLGFFPSQPPHPPMAGGAQSPGAVRRAARLADGVFLGPQVAWRDLQELVRLYKQARQAARHREMGTLGASRCLLVGCDRADAAASARDDLAKTFNYKRWRMQERRMVPL